MLSKFILAILALAGALCFGSGDALAQNCLGQPAANTICAGPSSGSAGLPGFRAQVAADLPGVAARTDLANNWTAPCCQGFLVTTQPWYVKTNDIASTAFVNNAIRNTMSTLPIGSVTGGTYSFASIGTQGLLSATASAGAITSVTGWASGTGWKVGDLYTLTGSCSGNGDAIIRVTTIDGSGIPTASTVLYGGTGYVTQNCNYVAPEVLSSFTLTLTGTLTSNATFVMPKGTYLTQSDQWIVNNNTTGAFTVTFQISNGSDVATGTGVVVAQGSNNSTATLLQTDGVNDIWLGTVARTKTSSLTLYVSATGSASGSCTSAGSPCTFAQAMANVANLYDFQGGFGGCTFQINLADGTYTNLPLVLKNTVGDCLGLIFGNLSTPANVVITCNAACGSSTNQGLVLLEGIGGSWIIAGMKLTSTGAGNNGIALFDSTAVVKYNTIEFGALTGTADQIVCQDGGRVENTGALTISGGATNHIQALNFCVVHERTGPVTISGTPAFGTSFAKAHNSGAIGIAAGIYSGSATGVSCTSDGNSVIDSAGTFASLPGNAACNVNGNPGGVVK